MDLRTKNWMLVLPLLLPGSLCAMPLMGGTQDESLPYFKMDAPSLAMPKADSTESELVKWCLPDTVTTWKETGLFEQYVYTLDDRGNALVTEYFNAGGEDWMPVQRIDAVFNVWDEIDTTVNYVWQGTGYVPTARKISTYDQNGNRTTLLNEIYDMASGEFYVDNRYTYTYTEEGRLQESLKEEPANTMPVSWMPLERQLSTYDAEGNETAFEYFLWDGASWREYRCLYREYGKNLLLRELCMAIRVDGSYDSAYEQVYQYDAQGNNTDYLYRTYDSLGWSDAVHRTMTYSTTGRLLEYVSAIWDNAMNGWMNQSREVYVYDQAGNNDSLYIYAWESYAWNQTACYDYEYDANGRLSSYVREGLRYETMERDRYEFERDEDGNAVSGTCLRYSDTAWVPVGLYDLRLTYADGSLAFGAGNVPLHHIEISYARGEKELYDPTSVRPALAECEFSVWPNPVRDVLHVQPAEDGLAEIRLLDASGRLLQRATCRGGSVEFDMEGYSGLVFVQLKQAGGMSVKKVVVL